MKSFAIALLLVATIALAQSNPALDTRLKKLEEELRCLVCQNQSLADSNAPLAEDLRRGGVKTLAIVIARALAIAAVRGRLFQAEQQVKETSDVYVLPPPEQVVSLSLGYRAAVADVLWAHVLVSQGLHTAAKRRFGSAVQTSSFPA